MPLGQVPDICPFQRPASSILEERHIHYELGGQEDPEVTSGYLQGLRIESEVPMQGVEIPAQSSPVLGRRNWKIREGRKG